MIIETFMRWAEKAKASERAKAANALGRAYLHSTMDAHERQAALLAMTWLLDDPSPKVRLALAQALGGAEQAPRALILSLCLDQPEIAAEVIGRSPILSDIDLVDLAARGDGVTRALIASRYVLTQPVCAAIAEIGDEAEIEIMLANPGAIVTRHSLRRIAERHAGSAILRDMLLEREELPLDARHRLALSLSEALGDSDLVRNILGARRSERLLREACEEATVALAGIADASDMDNLIDHLAEQEFLTPAFLMQALCLGKIDFFAAAISHLSSLQEKRVRSILADGRWHAIRALYEAAGLAREMSEVFVEATLEWRRQSVDPHSTGFSAIATRLVDRFRSRKTIGELSSQLIDMVERLHFVEQRQSARAYASFLAVEAA